MILIVFLTSSTQRQFSAVQKRSVLCYLVSPVNMVTALFELNLGQIQKITILIQQRNRSREIKIVPGDSGWGSHCVPKSCAVVF